jgi:hypothetical protein
MRKSDDYADESNMLGGLNAGGLLLIPGTSIVVEVRELDSEASHL